MPPLEEWETWPFDGSVEPRTLEPPVAAEQPRHGAGGVGCRRCERGLDGVLWSNDNWLVSALAAPSGLPVVVILETREHLDFPVTVGHARGRTRPDHAEGAAVAAIWDDILPPLPRDVWQANLEIVRAELNK